MSIFDNDEFDAGANDILEEIEQSQAQIIEEEQQADSALNEAVKRIEEANLWKLIISQDVFEAGSARPEILMSANRRIKQFATHNLQVLLGIKQDRVETVVKNTTLPFDEMEIQALKLLLAKMLRKEPPQAAVAVPAIKKGLAPQVNESEAAPQLKRIQSGNQQKAKASPVPQQVLQKPVRGKKNKLPGGQTKPADGKLKATTMNGMSLMQAGAIGKPAMSISGDGAGSANLMQQVMNNLLPGGASLVELGSDTPDGGDSNERF